MPDKTKRMLVEMKCSPDSTSKEHEALRQALLEEPMGAMSMVGTIIPLAVLQLLCNLADEESKN